MSRPFAVFDIDGTIIRWQLYHAIGDRLAKQGIIEDKAFQQVREARMNWKRREGGEGFRQYEAELVKVFNQALVGLEVNQLAAIAQGVFEEYKDQVYTYSRDLILGLKEQNYLIFAVSGSPAVIVQMLAEHYGFDDFAATEFIAKDGRFTGEVNLSLGRKPELLQSLVAKHQATFRGSIGVGDSEGDIDMLELVEEPTALNPSKLLFQHAREQGWHIVLERKNMIYHLEPGSNGSYVLAQTNAN
jgi:HAD superfamily hydrolase (TIGR01490 family)